MAVPADGETKSCQPPPESSLRPHPPERGHAPAAAAPRAVAGGVLFPQTVAERVGAPRPFPGRHRRAARGCNGPGGLVDAARQPDLRRKCRQRRRAQGLVRPRRRCLVLHRHRLPLDPGRPADHEPGVRGRRHRRARIRARDRARPRAPEPARRHRVERARGDPGPERAANSWTVDQIRHNVLDKYALDQLRASAFDPRSIMLYFFPARWTRSGVGTSANNLLSEDDKAWAAMMYPKSTVPSATRLTVGAAPTAASIGTPGRRTSSCSP